MSVLHNKDLLESQAAERTFDPVHMKEQLMCACTDRQGGAGLIYASANGRGGAESVTFDLKIGGPRGLRTKSILVVQNAKDVQRRSSG